MFRCHRHCFSYLQRASLLKNIAPTALADFPWLLGLFILFSSPHTLLAIVPVSHLSSLLSFSLECSSPCSSLPLSPSVLLSVSLLSLLICLCAGRSIQSQSETAIWRTHTILQKLDIHEIPGKAHHRRLAVHNCTIILSVCYKNVFTGCDSSL